MRIVILANDGYFANILVRTIFLLRNNQIQAVFLSKRTKRSISRLWAIFKKTHYKYFVYRIFIFLFFEKLLNLVRKESCFSINKLAKHSSIPVLYSRDINSPKEFSILQSFKPDVIISANLDQILKKPVLELPKHGCINCHASLLPDYKGISPYFWILVNREPYGGITIYKMGEGIDEGEILAQKKISTENFSTLFKFNQECVKEGENLLVQVLENLTNGLNKSKGYSGKTEGRYYSFPTKSAVRTFYAIGKKLVNLRDLLDAFRESEHFYDRA